MRPKLPAELTSLLARMLSKKPGRPTRCEYAGQRLHAVASNAREHPPLPLVDRISHPLRLLAFTTPVAVFLLVGVGIIVIEHFLGTPLETSAPPIPPSMVATQAAQTTQANPSENRTSDSHVSPAPIETAGPVTRDKTRIEPDPYLEGLDKKQVELRLKRTELLLKYTKQHPDVVRVDRELEQLRIERRAYLRKRKKN